MSSEQPSTFTRRETRRRKAGILNDLDCCGGSVDVGSEYVHEVSRFDRDFLVSNLHADPSECYAYRRP